ncbi:grf1-interacting factor, variant 2 [Balamuthia mandrillaris]
MNPSGGNATVPQQSGGTSAPAMPMTNESAPPMPAPMTTESIQKCLDENRLLILAIAENQGLGKYADSAMYQKRLQQNLISLATLADQQPALRKRKRSHPDDGAAMPHYHLPVGPYSEANAHRSRSSSSHSQPLPPSSFGPSSTAPFPSTRSSLANGTHAPSTMTGSQMPLYSMDKRSSHSSAPSPSSSAYPSPYPHSNLHPPLPHHPPFPSSSTAPNRSHPHASSSTSDYSQRYGPHISPTNAQYPSPSPPVSTASHSRSSSPVSSHGDNLPPDSVGSTSTSPSSQPPSTSTAAPTTTPRHLGPMPQQQPLPQPQQQPPPPPYYNRTSTQNISSDSSRSSSTPQPPYYSGSTPPVSPASLSSPPSSSSSQSTARSHPLHRSASTPAPSPYPSTTVSMPNQTHSYPQERYHPTNQTTTPTDMPHLQHRSSSSSSSRVDMWTKEEHARLLLGLKKYGHKGKPLANKFFLLASSLSLSLSLSLFFYANALSHTCYERPRTFGCRGRDTLSPTSAVVLVQVHPTAATTISLRIS